MRYLKKSIPSNVYDPTLDEEFEISMCTGTQEIFVHLHHSDEDRTDAIMISIEKHLAVLYADNYGETYIKLAMADPEFLEKLVAGISDCIQSYIKDNIKRKLMNK